MRPTRYTPEQIQKAKDLFAAGVSTGEIRKRCGFKNISTAQYWAYPGRKEKSIAAARAYHKRNRQHIREQQRKYAATYWKKNREKIAAKWRLRLKEDPEFRARIYASNRRSRIKHAEKNRAYRKAYYQKHRERILANHKIWREARMAKQNPGV